jgi:LysR family glycine cleavage system transcriptional activator
VTLHCTSSVATLWLAPQLRSFQISYPNIDLRINTLDLGHENRRSSRADLEIFTAGDIIKDPYTTKLLTSTILPVCSAKLFAKGPQLELPADVLKHELIHVLGYDDDWHRWFRKFQLNNVDVPHGLSVDSSLIAIEAVQRGDGIMLGRRPFIDHYLESGELVEVFKKPFCLYTDYNLRQPAQVSGQHASAKVAMWLTGLVDKRDIQGQFT